MCYDNDRLLLEEICCVFIEMLVDLEDIQNMKIILNFQFMILRVCAKISHRDLYLTISDIVTIFDC